jgi:AAA family ATP:ADP antiporter
MAVAAGATSRIGGAFGAREGEGSALFWSSAYYFLVLAAYYVLRPIRDEIGAASGAEKLAWLFTGTLVGMLLVHPLYASLVAKLPRRRFIPLAYRFFILNLVAFFVAFRVVDPAQVQWVGWVFFIWTSVFNLFVVSVFWSLVTDVFSSGQGKRLFGIVAVGGTVGAVAGSSITASLVGTLGPLNLMLVSAAILELAVQAAGYLDRREGALRAADEAAVDSAVGTGSAAAAPAAPARSSRDEVIGGGVLEGIKHAFASPYLLGIAALVLTYAITSTFLYFQQADIVARVFADDRAARTRVFANVDLAANSLTLLAQLFLTGRVMTWFGVGIALAVLPLLTLVGFGILGVAPVLGVLVAFQVVRRASTYAFQRPAREALFSVLPRTDKYKAKNFSDTFVYRLGDQVGAWSYSWMAIFGLGLSGLAFTMVPLSAAWLVLALWLGRQHAARERRA